MLVSGLRQHRRCPRLGVMCTIVQLKRRVRERPRVHLLRRIENPRHQMGAHRVVPVLRPNLELVPDHMHRIRRVTATNQRVRNQPVAIPAAGGSARQVGIRKLELLAEVVSAVILTGLVDLFGRRVHLGHPFRVVEGQGPPCEIHARRLGRPTPDAHADLRC